MEHGLDFGGKPEKRIPNGDFDMKLKLKLKKQSSVPIYKQVFDGVARAVEQGRLVGGDRIPSVVGLADQLGISRPTVVRAFRELERAGVIVSRVGRGSFVADDHGAREPLSVSGVSPLPRATSARPVSESPQDRSRFRAAHCTSVSQLMAIRPPDGVVDLRLATPVVSASSQARLTEALHIVAGKTTESLYTYHELGYPPFVQALADWLNQRGYDILPEQIVVTNGVQGAVSLISLWLQHEHRRVFCESPVCHRVHQAMELHGFPMSNIPWKNGKFEDADVRTMAIEASLFYCTPDFQNPTGACLNEEARDSLATAAFDSDLLVVVNEIFRELRFTGDDLPSVYTLLPKGRRILVSSFSKTLAPGLRLGFIVADGDVVTALTSIKRQLDLGCSTLSQAMMAELLRVGYAEHLADTRKCYRVRCNALCDALSLHLPKEARFTCPEGGFHLWVNLPPGISATELYFEALECGVAIRPGPTLDIDAAYDNAIRISYGHAEPDEIERGVSRIARAISNIGKAKRDYDHECAY